MADSSKRQRDTQKEDGILTMQAPPPPVVMPSFAMVVRDFVSDALAGKDPLARTTHGPAPFQSALLEGAPSEHAAGSAGASEKAKTASAVASPGAAESGPATPKSVEKKTPAAAKTPTTQQQKKRVVEGGYRTLSKVFKIM